jgi:hypothetical protein
VNLVNSTQFGAQLVEELMKRGLGSMSKTELEALLLHLVEKNSGEPLSNADLALALRTPVSKIKRLRHEAVLRFGNDDLEKLFRQRLCTHLQSATFEFPKKSSTNAIVDPRMILVIEDEFLRSQLLGKLKKHGSYADWSFNSELLKVCPKTLMKVAIGEIPEDEQRKLAAKLRLTSSAKLKQFLLEEFERLISASRDSAAGKTLEYIISLAGKEHQPVIIGLRYLLTVGLAA